MDDLTNLGYPNQPNRIRGVFFQHDGMWTPALGATGGRDFLVSVDSDNNVIIEDCWFNDNHSNCKSNINRGGIAHELGHALGLNHPPDNEPQGGYSVMGTGLFGFPLPTFINTTLAPERNQLYTSPFMNIQPGLSNGGFDNCLSQWTVTSGSPLCSTAQRHSGQKALELPAGGPHRLSQEVTANGGQIFDFSGWMYKPTGTGTTDVTVYALSPSNLILATFAVASRSSNTPEWERVATSLTMPAGTSKIRIEFSSQGLDSSSYLDDFDWHIPQSQIPTPIPIVYYDGDALPTLQPILRWSDISSSTSYQVQVATDRNFNSLLVNSTTQSPFLQVAGGLVYNQRYYWRVKATNGGGASSWSLIWSFIPRPNSSYYNAEFENATYDSTVWSWVRETNVEPNKWRFESGGPGYLVIQSLGDLGPNNNARNIFLRYPPSGDFSVTTKMVFGANQDYQQGGLLIYQDDDNHIRLMRAHNNQYKIEWSAEMNGTTTVSTFAYLASTLPLRIVRTGNSYTGYYSPDGISWKRVGPPVTANWTNPRVGVATYNPLNTNWVQMETDWIRFSTPCYTLTTTIQPTNGGTVTTSPGDCDGGTGYSAGSTAILTASPNSSYRFSGWSGDASGTTTPLNLTMNMDKTITGTFAFSGYFKIFLPFAARSAINLAINGSFEDGNYASSGSPTGWFRDAWNMGNTSMTWDNTTAKSGTKSVKIFQSVLDDARWVQTVAVQPNKNYRLSGWIKTSQVAQGVGASIGIYETWDHTTSLFGTNDWTFVSMSISSGSNTQLILACRLGHWGGESTGTMWCDDIVLELLN